MPYTKKDYPDSLKNFDEATRMKAIDIINAMIADGYEEGRERGDYFNYIRVAEDEKRQVFPSVDVIQLGRRAAVYVCSPKY